MHPACLFQLRDPLAAAAAVPPLWKTAAVTYVVGAAQAPLADRQTPDASYGGRHAVPEAHMRRLPQVLRSLHGEPQAWTGQEPACRLPDVQAVEGERSQAEGSCARASQAAGRLENPHRQLRRNADAPFQLTVVAFRIDEGRWPDADVDVVGVHDATCRGPVLQQ